MAALKGVKTLDMVDGEITKVAYEGEEYEKTDRPVEAGDLFLLKEGHFIGDADDGAFYTTKKYEDGDIVIPTASIGNASYTQSIGKGVAFRKKHTCLKVGDYAKLVGVEGLGYQHKEGDLVKIIELDFSAQQVCVKGVLNNDITWEWVYAERVDLATEDEVTAAKEVEAKRSVEAKWAKIGRKVGEYKVGDIVAYDDQCWFGNSGIGEVVEGTYMNYQVRVAATDRVGFKNEYYLQKSQVALITPVEARFDRS